MDKATKIILPSPNFEKANKPNTNGRLPPLTPSGMTLLPRTFQPNLGARQSDPNGNAHVQMLGKRISPNEHKPAIQFCETCEMELPSEDELRRHRAKHERCPVEGCSYRGHPKVMDKHIITLHSTGLFDKYKKLSTPEEIAAWREERKKRYPTIANVEMHQKAREQRHKRGERLEANKSRFGKREDRLRIQKGAKAEQKKAKVMDQNSEQKKSNENNIQRTNRRKKKKIIKHTKSEETEKLSKEATTAPVEEADDEMEEEDMFRGTSQLENYKHMKPKCFVKENNPLTSFLGVYESEEDVDDEGDYSDGNNVNSNTEVYEKVPLCVTCNDSEADTEAVDITDSHLMTITERNNFETNGDIAPKEEVEKEPLNIMDQSNVCNSGNIRCDTTLHDEKLTKKKHNSHSKAAEGRPNISTNSIADNQTIQKCCSSDEAPEEAPIEKSSHIPDLPLKKEPPRKRVKVDNIKSSSHPSKSLRGSSGLDYRKALRKQNTMLEKLLESDIRHERNVLLQCVRFVCENNFFGVGQKSSENSENKSV